MNAHEDCFASEPCAAGDAERCPKEVYRRNRRQGTRWPQLVLRNEGLNGYRHYLEGKPVHCGDAIELQALEVRVDDVGDYMVPLQKGVRVRYEAQLQPPRPSATLHRIEGEHEFIAGLEEHMRFRWPPQERR